MRYNRRMHSDKEPTPFISWRNALREMKKAVEEHGVCSPEARAAKNSVDIALDMMRQDESALTSDDKAV